MVDKLSLMTGIDIPFTEAELIIHPPTLKEISLVTEKSFFQGLDLLLVTKEKLNIQDKNVLQTKNDFDIFMTIVTEGFEDEEMSSRISNILLVLTLLFPSYEPTFTQQGIMLKEEQGTPKFISTMNFDLFQEKLNDIFCITDSHNRGGYNPGGPKSRALVEKFKNRAKKLNKNKEDISFYEKMISILSVGFGYTPSQVGDMTIYQIHKLFERNNKKEAWDFYIDAKIQGATGMDEVQNWLSDLFGDK